MKTTCPCWLLLRKPLSLPSVKVLFKIRPVQASLNYLKRLPVDVLKIDRSFIQDIETDPSDSAIVSGIVALAETLNMETVAEGVETEGQRAILKKLGCNSFQGYLVAKPKPADKFEEQFLVNSKTKALNAH